jgi:hypothetical protein
MPQHAHTERDGLEQAVCWRVEGWASKLASHDHGKSFYSPAFPVEGLHGWRLDCYPNGYGDEGRGHVSLFLCGPDSCATTPVASRFHEVRRVVSNLAVFDFEATDADGVPTMRLRSVHPGVTVEQVVEATGCEVVVPDDVPTSPEPSAEQIAEIDRLDPKGLRHQEVPES